MRTMEAQRHRVSCQRPKIWWVQMWTQLFLTPKTGLYHCFLQEMWRSPHTQATKQWSLERNRSRNVPTRWGREATAWSCSKGERKGWWAESLPTHSLQSSWARAQPDAAEVSSSSFCHTRRQAGFYFEEQHKTQITREDCNFTKIIDREERL